MSLLTLLLTSFGVAADAFAVSVGKGMHLRRLVWKPALQLAITFGAFQALMPVIGWALASQFAAQVEAFDHWIAFGLLVAIGAKMLWESRHADDDDDSTDEVPDNEVRIGARELVVLGVATSIDALAVGVSFAFLDVSILAAAAVIGVVTFVASLVGYRLGHHAGQHLRSYAEIAGGLILIGIGVKILVEHLAA